MSTLPNFIVAKPGQPCPSYHQEVRYYPASIQRGHQIISLDPIRSRPFTRKVGRQIGVRGDLFDLTSSGNPIKNRDGTQIRRTTPEDLLTLADIVARLEALREEHRLALIRAWENGETVHETDATNHPSKQPTHATP